MAYASATSTVAQTGPKVATVRNIMSEIDEELNRAAAVMGRFRDIANSVSGALPEAANDKGELQASEGLLGRVRETRTRLHGLIDMLEEQASRIENAL